MNIFLNNCIMNKYIEIIGEIQKYFDILWKALSAMVIFVRNGIG